MKKLWTVLGGLVAFILILPACGDRHYVCGGGPKQQTVDIEGLMVDAYAGALPASEQTANVLKRGALVSANKLHLYLSFKERFYARALPSRGGFAAWADCVSPELSFTETVDSLVITSRYDFDSRHPAGTALNDVFKLDAVSLADLLRTPQSVEVLRNQYLILGKAPATQGPQQFTLRYYQRNGETYVAETVPLVVLP